MSPDAFVNGVVEEWDPLDAGIDPGLLVASQKREIRNILKSYTGYYDMFSELIQNSLDAVDKRSKEGKPGYNPTIFIKIDQKENAVSVTDNGCGMPLAEFRSFLKPNLSFKDGVSSRGNKGVGATYLAYGFNYLAVATKINSKTQYIGALTDGRRWLDDAEGIVTRPKVTRSEDVHDAFNRIDRGTSLTVKLTGDNIRPKNLLYHVATTAEQWRALLTVYTPLGGIHLCAEQAPDVTIHLEVVTSEGNVSSLTLNKPSYFYPHKAFDKVEDIREFLKEQQRRIDKQLDASKIPHKFTGLNGIWGEWTGEDILTDKSIIKPKLTEGEKARALELGIKIYAFLGFSTELWDNLNDERLALRKGARILRGGLQLATRNMPQGETITIPLTNNVGFQNLAHIIVHYDNAEPDLGRKGFQPEHTKLAEKLAFAAVTAMRRYYNALLKTRTGSAIFGAEMKLEQWIDSQKEHERNFPLVVTGKGLFQPTEELAIRSVPIVEQDVVALFNQMLSSGLVRGIQLLSSSQYNQYDGLYRFCFEPPFVKYIWSEDNPLGVSEDRFLGAKERITSSVRILEYKHNVDALIEEFSTGEKDPKDIGLVVAWDMGKKWAESFDVVSFLDDDNQHHRTCHGITHAFIHQTGGTVAFELIILNDLISYCMNRENEIARQKELYAITI